MIAAIYARKSTEQSVADEAKSVTRQIEHGRAYAARKGWAVDDAHVYIDDGVSGAEFERRPGYVRLMGALKPRAPFQVLLMSESSRLGRESWQTGAALKQLLTAGVRVFFYLEDRECTFDHPLDKLQFSMVQAFDEWERAKASQRATDTAARKARAGHVTGGRVFGYTNVEVRDAAGRRAHVERVVNDAEAAVVRRVFDLAASGIGQKRIAKYLNDEGVVSPRPQRGRPAAWAPSSVHEVLFRSLYRGEIVWNQTRKRDAWGQCRQTPRPETEWLRVPAPDLRIVSEELWVAAHTRIAEARDLYRHATKGLRGGRPRIESRYLLPGLARCGWCGGGLHVRSGNNGSGANRRRVYTYACSSYQNRGTTVCSNALQVRMDVADQVVLAKLQELMTPSMVDEVVIRLRELTEGPEHDPRVSLERELAKAEHELMNLADAIAEGRRFPVLLQKLDAAEQRRQHLLVELLQTERRPQPTPVNWREVERRARERLTDVQALLAHRCDRARKVLKELLVAPIAFTPFQDNDARGYRFRGEVTVTEWLLEGSIPTNGKWRPHRDSNPGFSLERAAS